MTAVDWSVLDIEGVEGVADSVARKVNRQYEATEYDDLYQEALIILAQKSVAVRGYTEDDNLGGLHHYLWCDLINVVKTDAEKRSTNVSYERAREGAE